MNILKLLKKDHQTVNSIFKRLEMTSNRASKTKLKLFHQVRAELEAHAMVEEEIVYTPMREDRKAHDQILEAYEEHNLVRQLLDELTILSMDDERWDAKLSVLKEMVEHHVEEEEKTMFKHVERRFDAEDLEHLGDAFQTRKEEWENSSRPSKVVRSVAKRLIG